MKYLKRVGGILILGFVAGCFFFTNCSRNPENASIPSTAFLSPDEKIARLKEDFKHRVPASFCLEDFSYSCQRRVYSADVNNAFVPSSQECGLIGDSVRICPSIQTIQFNTEAAQQNCNGCEESYEYLEYSCHLKIPNNDGIYPISITRATLNESLYELHQFCTSIAYGSAGPQ